MTLFTVGHSTRTLGELIALLQAHGVSSVVDVRRYPGSRRHPHFSRESLAAALPAQGIAYRHAPELGGRRAPRPDSPNGAWRSPSFRAYADHMTDPEWQAALATLLDVAAGAPTAIMCAEVVPWRCHRQLIADALVARQLDVRHIISAAPPEPHTLSPHAVVGPDAALSYPAPGQRQGELF